MEGRMADTASGACAAECNSGVRKLLGKYRCQRCGADRWHSADEIEL